MDERRRNWVSTLSSGVPWSATGERVATGSEQLAEIQIDESENEQGKNVVGDDMETA